MRLQLVFGILIIANSLLCGQRLYWENGVVYKTTTNAPYTGILEEFAVTAGYYFKIKIKNGRPQGPFIKELSKLKLKGNINWKNKKMNYVEIDRIPERKEKRGKVKITSYSRKTKYTPPIEDYPLIFEHSQLIQRAKLPKYGQDTIAILENDLNYFEKVDVNKPIVERLKTTLPDGYYIIYYTECKMPALEGHVKNGKRKGKWLDYEYCSFNSN